MMRRAVYVLLPLAVVLLYFIFIRQGENADAPSEEPALPAPVDRAQAAVYWTLPGLEPDKCVAAWLLTRHVTPGARVVFSETPVDGTPFDVPGCEFQRQLGKATSELVADRYRLDDPLVRRVVAVVREIELVPWSMNDDSFFLRVRSGLAEAVNSSESDEACLAEALSFLDDLSASQTDSAAP